ncbi:hypothetical protein B7463_g5342, partial [Scytalidium lignicola]
MADWFRPVFHRARSQPTPQADRQGGDNNHGDDNISTSRIQSDSKVSSFLNPASNTQTVASHDLFRRARRESVRCEPQFEADQQVESLKVLMMTKSSLDPVPVDYNSCILQLLEGYQVLRSQVIAKDRLIESMKKQHAKELEELRVVIARLEEGQDDNENNIHNTNQWNTEGYNMSKQNAETGIEKTVAPDFSCKYLGKLCHVFTNSILALARRSVLDYLPWNKGSLKARQRAQHFEAKIKSRSQSKRMSQHQSKLLRAQKHKDKVNSHQAMHAIENGTAATHYTSVFYETSSNSSTTSSSDSLDRTMAGAKPIDIYSRISSRESNPRTFKMPPGTPQEVEATVDDYRLSSPLIIPGTNPNPRTPAAESQGFSFRPGDDLYESFNRSPHGPRELSVAVEENRYYGERCNYSLSNIPKKKEKQKKLVPETERPVYRPYMVEFEPTKETESAKPQTTFVTEAVAVQDFSKENVSPTVPNEKQQIAGKENQNHFDPDDAMIAAIRAIAARSSSNASTSTQRRRSAIVAGSDANMKKDS